MVRGTHARRLDRHQDHRHRATTEGLVRVIVHHVDPKITRPGLTQDGVHVRTIHVDQSAKLVDHAGDLANLRIENTHGVRIGHHEHSNAVIKFALEVVDINQAIGIALDGDGLKTSQGGARGVGTVSTVWNKHDRAILFAVAEIGGGTKQRRQFTLRAGSRLQTAEGQTRDLAEVVVQFRQQVEQALQGIVDAVRMDIHESGVAGQPFVSLRVVLHRARTKRVEVAIDRHIAVRKIDIVANDFKF